MTLIYSKNNHVAILLTKTIVIHPWTNKANEKMLTKFRRKKKYLLKIWRKSKDKRKQRSYILTFKYNLHKYVPSSFPFSYSFFENIIDLSNMNTWRVLPPSFVKCFKELFLTSQTVNVSCSSNFPWSSKLPLRKTILAKRIIAMIIIKMTEMKRLVSWFNSISAWLLL